MNKILKIAGFSLFGLIAVLYLCFLFVVPHLIDVNKYMPELQKLVKDNTDLNLNIENAEIITSPFLEAGIKTKNISVKLPDGSELFTADSFKTKVFLPELLLLKVRVSCAEVESPKLNVEILNGEKFKAAKVYEDLVNRKRKENKLQPPVVNMDEESSQPFDISRIKIIVPSVKLNNYSVVIDDTSAAHKLVLKGEQLKAGYFNGERVKLKTEAKFFSDNDENITANIDIDSFLPEFSPSEKEELDEDAVFALPFVNPVTTYRDYNLKSNINSKLKIRQDKKTKKIKVNGFADIEGTSVTLSGLQIPESYFRLKAKDTFAQIDTNLYVTKKEYIKLFGDIDYGKNPYIDLNIKSPKVHFANILNIAKAYLNTIHIKNNLDDITASGYLLSNARLKTDFSEIESSGKIIIREGNISDKNIGLLFNNMHANLFFDDNIFKLSDTHVLINNRPFEISGTIDSNSIANFSIKGDKIPLPGLYKAFAPREIKNAYDLALGFLSIDTKVTGAIKDIAAILKSDLTNLVIRDRAGNFVLSNNALHFGVANYSGVIKGRLTNKGFNFTLPKTNSVIRDDLLIVDIDNKLIKANPSDINVNRMSKIKLSGDIKNYLSEPEINFFADGALAASDIGLFAGEQTLPYFELKGNIPVKGKFSAKGNKVKLIAQAKANENNYITPVRIASLLGQQTILQFKAEKKGEVLKINRSGIYTKKSGARFDNDLAKNMNGAKEIIGMKAIISNLSTNPFINLFKISVPRDLDGSIGIFRQSRFRFGGSLFVFGNVSAPRINGNFYIRNLAIPELYTTVRQIVLNLGTRNVDMNISDVNTNGSDFRIDIKSNWNLLSKMILSDVRVVSRLINVDKLMQVSEAAMRYVPASAGTAAGSSGNADIPIEIRGGGIRLHRITTGDIVVNNTTGRISLLRNIFYLNNLRAHLFDGQVNGDVTMNLISTELNAKLRGKNFDVEKMLLESMKMKDTLDGNMNFLADLSLRGTSMEEQMKTLKGFIDFNIKQGTLGPFGKFENFLMAENIRENAFFSSTIGSVITNLVTIDTAHFEELYGHLTFNDGIANIAPIKSQGDVMSIYIAGKLNLLDNSADMSLRGKLASTFSDALGPLSNINPVNLVKHTPGVNVVAAKAFAIFCQAVSEEEMKAIPQLGKGKTDENATKFQIVLRGDTRKPLKMIKSFKWLALDSEIESAQNFVDTIPTPVEGEEGLSIEELIQLRQEQAEAAAQGKTLEQIQSQEEEAKSLMDKIRSKLKNKEK